MCRLRGRSRQPALHGDGHLRVSPEDHELLEAIEDRVDIEAARKALREPGRQSWDEVRAELAL